MYTVQLVTFKIILKRSVRQILVTLSAGIACSVWRLC